MQALNPGGRPGQLDPGHDPGAVQHGVHEGQFGLASAMGVVLAIVTLVFAAIVFIVNRLTGGKDGCEMA